MAYLKDKILSSDKVEVRKVIHQSSRYLINQNGILYRKAYLQGPELRCLNPKEAELVLKEIHTGVCWNHSSARSFARKAITQGYYWPKMHNQAKEFVKRCMWCQRFAPSSYMPATYLYTPEPLVIYAVGTRHCWPSIQNSRRSPIHPSSDGLIRKINRSGFPRGDIIKASDQVMTTLYAASIICTLSYKITVANSSVRM